MPLGGMRKDRNLGSAVGRARRPPPVLRIWAAGHGHCPTATPSQVSEQRRSRSPEPQRRGSNLTVALWERLLRRRRSCSETWLVVRASSALLRRSSAHYEPMRIQVSALRN